MKTVDKRFLDYVIHPTSSNENSSTTPSTPSQLSFGSLLLEECTEMGLQDTRQDQYGYVTASLPSNIEEDIPVIGFIAHMDTSPDAPGENISPVITEDYDGGNIVLKDIIISPKEFPELNNYIGDTILTSDGTTLLGADDKAGIAEIMTAMEYLIAHPDIKHGKIKIAFTPDEEIGRGADFFDVGQFGADFAYTLDGGKIGELEYENFNAAGAHIHIRGKSVHPGSAKGIMKNAALIAAEIVSLFPSKETPAETEGYEGFYHLTSFSGNVSSAHLSCIIRDFDKVRFEERKQFLKDTIKNINKKYGGIIDLKIEDQYYNMAEKIADHMGIVDLAKEAMSQCGIKPVIQPIRGGTDGARLSYMGLPCPNLFAGGHNFHGPYEYIPVSSMEKAVKMIVKIIELSSALDFKKKI